MSDSTAGSASGFAHMVPGFEFMQQLVKGAGSTLPPMGQWVAPTLDPEELDKRIQELKTVQFWLQQNAALLGSTIQALEVQRMTLSTLKSMNVSLGDLTEALKIRVPEPAAAAPAAAPTPASDEDAAPAASGNAVDPMHWWGALTRQFTELASHAVKEGAASGLIHQGMDVASRALKQAAPLAAAAVAQATQAAQAAQASTVQAAQQATQQAQAAAQAAAEAAAQGVASVAQATESLRKPAARSAPRKAKGSAGKPAD